jgi:hypothetical protein
MNDADTANDDATRPIDSAVGHDTGPPIDAGPHVRFCLGKTAVLCEDFDDDNPLVEWLEVANPGATFALVTDVFRSSPRAIRGSVTPFNASRGGYASQPLVNAGAVTHARLSYALLVEQRPAGGEIEVNNLRFNCGGDCRSDFYLAINASGADLVEQSIPGDGGLSDSNYHDLFGAIPSGKWLRLSLEVVRKGATEMALTVDGVEVTRKSTFLVSPGTPIVNAGLTYANDDTTDASVVVDDVLFEVLP